MEKTFFICFIANFLKDKKLQQKFSFKQKTIKKSLNFEHKLVEAELVSDPRVLGWAFVAGFQVAVLLKDSRVQFAAVGVGAGDFVVLELSRLALERREVGEVT